MSNTARRHHHLSQFYLAGFTPLGTKDDLLAVIDKGDGRTFRTKPKNVAHQHDFNRIDMDGIAPDALETELSKIETTVADVLRGLHHDAPFEEDVKNVLLNWMSFLSVRSPQWRHFWNGLRMMHAGQVMPEVLASEEAWEANKRKVKENGGQSIDLDFDTMKQLHHEYGTDVRPTREWLIKTEFMVANAILKCLWKREWIIVEATDDTGPFITGDHPICLSWINLADVPPMERNNPGHGMVGTRIIFPLSRRLALIGQFMDNHEPTSLRTTATRDMVAGLNAQAFQNAIKQVYAPSPGFNIQIKEGVCDGTHLIQMFKKRAEEALKQERSPSI